MNNGYHTACLLKRSLLTLIVSCCAFSLAFAQRVPFFNINIDDGLIQSQPDCMVQDLYGHLWIGTLGGLSRFDGQSFTNYTIHDGLSSNAVHALAADKSGNIWIGSPAGVTRFNGKQMQHFTFHTSDNPGANSVSRIRIAEDSTAWCLVAGKVYSIRNGKSAAFNMPDSLYITSLLPEGNKLWLSSNTGVLYRVEHNKWHMLQQPGGSRIPFITQLYRDHSARIWVLTASGLFRVSGDSVLQYKVSGQSFSAFPPLLCMTQDARDHYWIGTNSGVIRFNDSFIQYYNKRNGLSNNNFPAVLADAEGNVWLASDGQGLFRFSGAMFTGLDESMGLPSGQIMNITSARTGRLYLGTYDAGLFEYDNGEIRPVSFPRGIKPAISSLAVRNGYEIWIGTRHSGLWRYDAKGFRSFTAQSDKLPSNFVLSLYTDRKNRLWVGFNNGVAVYERDSFRSIPLKPSSARSFYQIGNDSMLIATNNGIKLYDGNMAYPFITNSPSDNAVAQCFTMRGTELWIGTSDNGIISYDLATRKSVVYDKSNGLKSDFIYNITTDKEGNIWAGTGFGIHKISFAGKEPVISFYGKEQGVSGMESNHNAVHKMPDGSIWFGTTNGALHYNPTATMISPAPVSIVMQSVRVFGENVRDSSYFDSTGAWYHVPYHLKLPYRRNNISFNFHAISLSGNEQLRYRYRIEGLEAPWSNWSSISSVTYSALPAGKYTFVVECTTGNNLPVKELHYPFEIIAPFHQTNLFRLIILAGCILLGITLQYIANKRKQNRARMMAKLRREEQSKVRERTAEDFHDEVGNKLTRINVLANILKVKMEKPAADTLRIIDQIQDNTTQIYSGTKDILWSLKPSNDNLYEIVHRIRDVGVELFQDTEIEFSFTGPGARLKQFRLPLDVSRNVIMIFKEAMNNCLKYAGASHVSLEVSFRDRDVLQLKLKDNGKGFNMEQVHKGHGIRNMQVRSERIKGKLYIDTEPGKGTIITLTFRIPETRSIKIPSFE